MDVWVYEIYRTKNVLCFSSGINFFKMLDFLILIVDNLGKFWVFIAYFANTSVVEYFFGLICQSPPLFEMKRLEFLCTIQLKETANVFFPLPRHLWRDI